MLLTVFTRITRTRMKAPIPDNEAQRLAALKEYHILDTAAEQAYDDHHRPGGIYLRRAHRDDLPGGRVQAVVQVQAGLESARDAARRGVLRPRHSPIRTLDRAGRAKGCAVCRQRPGDPLTAYKVLCRFPLASPEGFALGTLCAIDRRPRQLSAEQKTAMRALARQVMALLELRRASARMAEALEKVKTLHGLLPICAWCKRIRDDQGYWNQVEAYFHEHTGADFTHGICPDCLKKQRPKEAGEG